MTTTTTTTSLPPPLPHPMPSLNGLPQTSEDTLYNFGCSSDEFAWRGNACAEIRARRQAMSGALFFDALLRLGGIDNASALYPPSSVRELDTLLKAIRGARYDEMKRDCLIYYLLKQGCDGREVGYASEKVISPQYISLADAYWWLDSGLNLNLAVCKLADARIMKDYTSKIMETLALHEDANELIRRFVRTCNPPLSDPLDMERYLLAMAETSFTDAWNYQRRLPDRSPIRKQLVSKLLSWCLMPKPKAQPLTELLAVPFSKFEEAEVQAFAKQPPENLSASSISTIRDLVCVRLIHSCKYVAAVKFDRQFPSSGASVRGTWGAERQRIVKEIISIMPSVERAQLELELAALGADARVRNSNGGSSWANAPPPPTTASSGSVAQMDLSGSWEDIGATRRTRNSNAPRSSIGGRPINSRASAPRPSLPNGSAPLSAGASPSRERANQSQTAQSSMVSGITTEVNMSPARPFSTMSASVSSKAAPRPPRPSMLPRPTRKSLGHLQTNGAQTNGSANDNSKSVNEGSKMNAFMSRNAFFSPQPARSISPDPAAPEMTESNISIRTASGRRSAARLPTPPRDGSEEAEGSQPSQSSSTHVDGSANHEANTSNKNSEDVDEGEDDATEDENEELDYSLFNSAEKHELALGRKKAATRLTPDSGEVSPQESHQQQSMHESARISAKKSTRTKADVDLENGDLESDEGSQRKKLKVSVSVPGGFGDEEDEHRELPSPTSASVENGRAHRHSLASSTNEMRHNAGHTPARRSTRKRAASVMNATEEDEEDIDSHPISIPGALFTSDDEINAFTSAASHSLGKKGKGKGRADEEELDELAPLPSTESIMSLSHSVKGKRKGASSAASATGMKTPRRSARSLRGDSMDPEELEIGTRSVRRSSRLTDASPQKKSSSSIAGANVSVSASTGRPKKSTRTSGAGATATGKGASKRR